MHEDGILTRPLVYRLKESALNYAPFMYIALELVHDELLRILAKTLHNLEDRLLIASVL